MSPDSDTVNITKLYRLKDNGSNWAVYRNRTTAYLKSKGLRSHLNGRVMKPVELVERYSTMLNTIYFYTPSDTEFDNPLTNTEVQCFEDLATAYDRNEGLDTDVLNNTLPPHIMREISHLPTLFEMWKALHGTFEH